MTKAYDFGLRFRIGRLLPQVQVTVQACSSRMTTGFTVLILSTIPIQVGRPPNSTTSSNGSLLLLARRHPGGSLPFLSILCCHPPAWPPPADRFRSPALALSAMAPRPPLLLRLLHLFLTSAAGTARGARRLRGTCTFSSS